MKELVAGVVLILVVGIAGFFYRNILERSQSTQTQVACTEEARVCPDGQTVSRSGPSCSFAVCPPPTVTYEQVGVAFVPPAGYVSKELVQGQDPALLGAFEKPSLSESVSHSIRIYAYPLTEGKTPEEVIIQNSMKSPSGMLPESMEEFTSRIAGNTPFQFIVIERFEAVVHSAYYAIHNGAVVKFEVIEHDVISWTDPNLVVESLPEHQALLEMLSTLALY